MDSRPHLETGLQHSRDTADVTPRPHTKERLTDSAAQDNEGPTTSRNTPRAHNSHRTPRHTPNHTPHSTSTHTPTNSTPGLASTHSTHRQNAPAQPSRTPPHSTSTHTTHTAHRLTTPRHLGTHKHIHNTYTHTKYLDTQQQQTHNTDSKYPDTQETNATTKQQPTQSRYT